MENRFQDEYQKRLFEANQKVLECYELLDPKAEDYQENLEALAKIQKELATDFKAYGDLMAMESHEELEEEKLVHEKKSAKIGHILQGLGLALSGATFITSTFFRDKHFKQANKYEQENAYLTTSDRKAVDEALKEDHKFWQFWK